MSRAELKELLKNKRQLLTTVSVVFIAYVLLVAGIFSYFHSEDKVTNRMTGKNGSVTIREPKWDDEGHSMAAKSEPGMVIPKDPSGVNNGQVELYVRLKMTVKIKDYEGRLEEADIPSDSERLDRIVGAVKYKSGAVDDTLLYEEGGALKCRNPGFVVKQGTSADTKERVYYFYSVDSSADGDASLMKSIAPDGSTAELFQHVDIPVYKKDYLGVFDQEYDIVLEAEGIPVSEHEDLTVGSAAEYEYFDQ